VTNSTTKTKSMGLRADALLAAFFALAYIMHRDKQLRFHYRDSYVIGCTVTRQLRATYRDWQKTRQPRHRRHLIKPPSRYSAFVLYPDPKLTGRTHYNSKSFYSLSFVSPDKSCYKYRQPRQCCYGFCISTKTVLP
jgi:hypothetical protein